MSYDVRLCDASGNVLHLDEAFEEGGTYALGGTTACDFNITYNYAEVFGSLVRDLDGKVASETAPALQAFCDLWPNAKPYENYWAPTPGNAKRAIARLLTFAAAHPAGIWEVS